MNTFIILLRSLASPFSPSSQRDKYYITVTDCTPNYWISSLCFSNSSSSLTVSTNHQIFTINVHTGELIWRHVHQNGPASSLRANPYGDTFMANFYAVPNQDMRARGKKRRNIGGDNFILTRRRSLGRFAWSQDTQPFIDQVHAASSQETESPN